MQTGWSRAYIERVVAEETAKTAAFKGQSGIQYTYNTEASQALSSNSYISSQCFVLPLAWHMICRYRNR